MRMRPLIGLMTAAMLAVPATASAAAFSIVIDGVDPIGTLAPPVAAPAPGINPYAGVFVGLGNCDSTPGSMAANACLLAGPPVGTNPMNTPAAVLAEGMGFTNAVMYGFGLKLDQVIFHRFQFDFDLPGGVITPPLPSPLQQHFDFVVGDTGGGSAGAGTFDYTYNLFRNVTVTGPTGSMTLQLDQTAKLTVGFFADILNFEQSSQLSFDLSTIGGTGTLLLQLAAAGPFEEGDPPIDVDMSIILPTAVPLPSTLALLGLGFAALVRVRRTAIA